MAFGGGGGGGAEAELVPFVAGPAIDNNSEYPNAGPPFNGDSGSSDSLGKPHHCPAKPVEADVLDPNAPMSQKLRHEVVRWLLSGTFWCEDQFASMFVVLCDKSAAFWSAAH